MGVWNWKGKNGYGSSTWLDDWDYIALKWRDVRLVFDSDVSSLADVRKALERLTEHLQRKGAHIGIAYLPAENGKKLGVDDYLVVGHTIQDLENLIDAPRLTPRATPPTMELLGTSPKSITRPMTLVDGFGYATTWLWVRLTITEVVNKEGEVVRLPEPQIEDRLERFIVRDDGQLYGDVVDPKVSPISDTGLTVHLSDPPPPNKIWSAAGVQAYLRGERPDTKTVFIQITDTVDRFIDFNRSLGDQRTMCEFVTCYILSTWFIEALTVIGYLWPNGERGSGKTQLLNVVTELAYLGQTILAGGSYAALRDLADYGATLAFDDAEAIMDVKRTDPDKRTLLLAGNRRGSTITVKEPVNGREWRTRYVNTFCPRLFSAIRMPDSVLASRTIVVPLIRTPDRYRANADPLNYALWPHQREKLLDDLWSLALSHINGTMAHAEQASEDAALSGRNLEPWHAILTVALWLDNQGCNGIFNKMNDLSQAYQKERPDLELADLTVYTIKALCNCAISANRAISAINYRVSADSKWTFETSTVKDEVVAIAESDESIDPSHISSRRVGRVLGKMRLRQEPRSGGKGKRKWNVSLIDLHQWLVSYGLDIPPELDPACNDEKNDSNDALPSNANGSNGTNGTNGTRPDSCPACGEKSIYPGDESVQWFCDACNYKAGEPLVDIPF